jgi:hypothetical protein
LTDGILIAGVSGLVVLLVWMSWRSRRDKSMHQTWAASPGWTECSDEFRRSLGPLRRLALTEIGHSRRVEAAFRSGDGALVLNYVCETGFERLRHSHRFIVAACQLDSPVGRMIVTREDWLLASARRPDLRMVSIGDRSDESLHFGGVLMAAAANPPELQRRLGSGLASWLRLQRDEQSWEAVGEYVFGYQAATKRAEAPQEMVRAVRELAALLSAGNRQAAKHQSGV